VPAYVYQTECQVTDSALVCDCYKDRVFAGACSGELAGETCEVMTGCCSTLFFVPPSVNP